MNAFRLVCMCGYEVNTDELYRRKRLLEDESEVVCIILNHILPNFFHLRQKYICTSE